MNDIILSLKRGVRTITFNRPPVKNAINIRMYQKITQTLTEDTKNDKIVLTIITGTGDFFTSGNDIKASLEGTGGSPDDGLRTVQEMVAAFIDYPKLLIAVVNGPAVGIGATLTALCDIVYASENAYFSTPFLRMGLCAEGVSTWTFPIMLGRSVASEMIFLGKKLSVQEAYRLGLVSKIIPQKDVENFIKKLHELEDLPVNNVIRNKRLLMANFRQILHDSNVREMKELKECTESGEFAEAALKFLSKRSKL